MAAGEHRGRGTRAGADAKAAAERSTTSKKVKEPKGADYFNVTLNPLVADWDPMMCAVLFLHLFPTNENQTRS